MVNGQGEAVIVSVAVFLGIAFLTCCLRGYVRFRITRVPGCDDYLMLTGMFFNIGLAICSILGAKEGIGRKLSYFEHRPLHFRHALLCFWLAQLFYSVTSVLVRLSIIITLLRLAVDKLQRRILYAVSTASLIAGLIFFFFTIFFCNPVVNHWERVRTHGKCKDVNYLLGVGYMYSGIAAVCDFTLGVLPIFMIGKLQMDWKFKMGVIALLSIGCLSVAWYQLQVDI